MRLVYWDRGWNNYNCEVSVLQSINNKLSILELLHTDLKDLKSSLKFSQLQIEMLQKENIRLKGTGKTLSAQVSNLANKNKIMKETILALQCYSMHSNINFSGIPQQMPDNQEEAIKQFIQVALKLPQNTISKITFCRVHCLSTKDTDKDWEQ